MNQMALWERRPPQWNYKQKCLNCSYPTVANFQNCFEKLLDPDGDLHHHQTLIKRYLQLQKKTDNINSALGTQNLQ